MPVEASGVGNNISNYHLFAAEIPCLSKRLPRHDKAEGVIDSYEIGADPMKRPTIE